MTTKNPLVSIICTNYNKGVWIRDAVDSFLSQKTNFEYEILLIDDKSTDESPSIIADYAVRYPEKIRAFYNNKNLGITKTWIKICREARGKYIARCDGDDYWTDDNKIQKQVDLLEKNKESAWCCTDYDVVTPKKEIIRRSAVETGFINRPKTYIEMLITKGFTMSSTWLINTDLLLSVNDSIDSNAIDDTFNIQLELFYRTKLTYLPMATVAYRTGYESDSKTTDINKAKLRNRRLLETQLEYVNKYKDVDFIKMMNLSLKETTRVEAVLTEKLGEIENADLVMTEQAANIASQKQTIDNMEDEISKVLNSRIYKVAYTITHPIKSVRSDKNK